mgnify:FL=1|tara:strand:- start:9639 stop:10481 length:843 start_codon:yes stop_codon:yes gene_type:complete
METHKILDRFEMLYPLNSKVADLRRACIDKDLHSVFRLIDDDTKEDLRKIILEDNQWSLWKILDSYVDTRFVQSLKSFVVNDITWDEDCFSQGQIKSKMWLLEKLKKLKLDLGTVFLCAGWYGTLATMLFESKIKVDKIRSFDIDESCVEIAEIFNKPWFVDEWKFKSITDDIMNIDYDKHVWQFWSNKNNRMSRPITDVPDTIINTSCEHIHDFELWYNKIPKGKLIILQGNDYFELNEHVNCSADQDSFSEKAPMTDILYLGTIDCGKYKRFMKIGLK